MSLALLAACGGSDAAVAPTSTVQPSTSADPTTTAVRRRTTVAPTLPTPTVGAPTTAVPSTLPAVPAAAPGAEQLDPDDAPPPDVTRPRDPNAGDFSSPYGPFGPFDVTPLSSSVVSAVSVAVDAYVEQAVLEPLRSGTAAPLDRLLTLSALGALRPDQRGVLTDEGLPVAPAATVESRRITVDGVTAPDGSSVANVSLDVIASGTTAEGSLVRTSRRGTLTLLLEAGAWRIDAFELAVDRELP